MKYVLLLVTLTSPFCGLSQTTHLRGKVIDSQVNKGFWGATLLFKQADKVVTGGSTDSAGVFIVKSIPIGTYDVDIESIGYRTETLTNVVISSDTLLPTIPFPGPCKYIYRKDVQVACVGGHTDHIVPIVYGLPGKRLMEKAKKEKLYLGGCQITGCDPKYYCLTHRKEL
jgi:hypothetical protein